MLEVKGLTVTYGAIRAVDRLDLTLGDGCTALLGPNGAGKSSTLRAISRLESSTGSITFDGVDITRQPAERVARAGLIHVPEGRRLFASLTVHENLQVGTTAAGGRKSLLNIDEVYDLFPPLVAVREREAWSLSGGEQQMVAIGRALLASPRLLMLDEPSLGLAPLIVESVYGALREVVTSIPILLVEQNTTVALKLAARAAVLVNGTVVFDGSSAEVSDREALLDSYLGLSAVD